jgi:hypothetical protein
MSRTSPSFVIACVATLAAAGCNNSPNSPSSSHVSPAAVSAARTKRTPDPAPGARLPLPDHFYVVALIAAQYPDALANACPERGGSSDFLDRVVRALRLEDSRWGYNGIGVPGEASQEIVLYNYSAAPDEGNSKVHAVDILGDRCGADPRPTWNVVTLPAGQVPYWSSRGRW